MSSMLSSKLKPSSRIQAHSSSEPLHFPGPFTLWLFLIHLTLFCPPMFDLMLVCYLQCSPITQTKQPYLPQTHHFRDKLKVLGHSASSPRLAGTALLLQQLFFLSCCSPTPNVHELDLCHSLCISNKLWVLLLLLV